MSERLDAAVRELVAAIRAEVSAPSGPIPDRLLAVSEVAESLGIGRSMVYTEMAAGRLRSIKVGRRRLVPAGAVREYIEQGGSQ